MATLVPGNRRGKSLVYLGFRYQKNRLRNDKIYWRCWRGGCRAPLQTNSFDVNADRPIIRVLNVGQHDHQAENERVRSSAFRDQMVNALRIDPTRSCRDVYNDVSNRAPRHHWGLIPRFDAVRSILDREQARHIPNIPRGIVDVAIHGRWARTTDGERFLSHIDNAWGIAVFVTAESLQCLGECRDLYLDGTFKTVPRPYRQFFLIHGYYQDRVVPLVFALMSVRQVGNYRQIFAHLKRRYNRLTGGQLDPDRVITDFEDAMLTSTETEFLRAEACACFFHFSQSIWRRVQAEGLKEAYNVNQNLKNCIRKLMAIAYLPVALVGLRLNFVEFSGCDNTRRLCQQYPGLRNIFLYFQRNYLDGPYEIRMWNVYARNINTRTNNHVESFNKRWNASVGRRHPNLWHFLRKLMEEEVRGKIAIEAADRGDAPPRRKRKYRLLQQRIERLQQNYRNGERTLNQYWRAMRLKEETL